ncbi:DUF2470 domain-containing protein [Streptomyces sp. NPDC006552]|uniref:DUF2470 domain-containing protein n=1 Tax=Streptomyces sp. NPDC006552 TaxID=3157179 RepID=UPI0033A4012F
MADPVTPPTPTDAERARTILAAAGSLALTATATEDRFDHVVLHAVDAAARLLLLDPADPRLTAALAAAPHSGLAVYAEVTDVAPVAVRERVRARLALSGRLTPAGPGTLVLRPARAALSEDDTVRTLDAAALGAAAPDPLAAQEAELLDHLDTGHADLLAELARPARADALTGVVAVRPLRLDRTGLVLRLERAATHQDVRVPFRTAAQSPHDVGPRIQELLDPTGTRAHR